MSSATAFAPWTQVAEPASAEPTQRAQPTVAEELPGRKTALDAYQSLWRYPTSAAPTGSAART